MRGGATLHGAMLVRTQGSSLGVCVVLGCVGNLGAVRGDRVCFRLRLGVCARTELSCLGEDCLLSGERFRARRGGVGYCGQQHGAVIALAVGCGDSFVVSCVWDAWELGSWADHPRRSAKKRVF